MDGKTLTELKEDKSKAERDLQQLFEQTLMIQGVIRYLAQEIGKIEHPLNRAVTC